LLLIEREFLFRLELNYKIEQEGYLSPWALAQVVNWWWEWGWGGQVYILLTKKKNNKKKNKNIQIKRR